MKILRYNEFLNENYIQDMKAFGLTNQDIDKDGYITVYHGGKQLPEKLNKDEIFFMTPNYDEALDYAKMRNGEVFTLKVKPQDVNFNQGSYEIEFDKGGYIKNGIIYPLEKKENKKVRKGLYNFDDEWIGNKNYRLLKEYKNIKAGDVMPKSGWKVISIIQYKSKIVQFEFNKGFYNANTVIKYEFDNNISESKNIRKLFHGTSDDRFDRDDNLIFLSEDSNFSKSYGDKLYIVEVDLGKIFNSLDLNDIKKIYKAGFRLTDPYITDYGEEIETYDYDDDEYKTAKDFINSMYTSDTWNAIESTEGVIDWILSDDFDSILITEGGVINYITTKNRILKMELY